MSEPENVTLPMTAPRTTKIAVLPTISSVPTIRR